MPHAQPYPDRTTGSPIQYQVALGVSGFLHPAVLPTYAFGWLLLALPTAAMPEPVGVGPQGRLYLLGLLSFMTLLLPVAMVAVAYYLGVVKDWQLRPKADRAFALWLTAALYIGGTWGLRPLLPTAMFYLMAGLAGLAALKAIVNTFYRMSGHGLAIAALAGYWGSAAARTAHPALVWPLVITILGTGAVAWARLTLGAHTDGEMAAGITLGAVSGMVVGWL